MLLKKLNLSGKIIPIIWIISMATQFKLCIKLLILLIIFTPISSFSEQYQSDEIGNAKPRSAQEQKSIQELEDDIDTLEDAYSKQSTARFLARHYVQQNSEAAIKKAIEYYLMALKGDGLSIYAKQETLEELLSLYYQQSMYSQFLEYYRQYIDLQGKPDAEMRIKQMLSLYHLEQTQGSHEQAKALLQAFEHQTLELGMTELTQILYVLYKLEDVLMSLRVQKWIVSLDEYSFDQWFRLSKLYIKANQPQKAASVLLSALQKGMVGQQENLLLTADLISQSGNPSIAARLLEQLLNQYYVDHNAKNFTRLFEYWYLAQEKQQAAEALRKSLKYEGNAERYLDLAELYYQLQEWQKMNAVIRQACESTINETLTGRANVLLGISALKTNSEQTAINAFSFAAMYKDSAKEAKAYLAYLDVDLSQLSQRSQNTSPCTPVND